jgi:glycosyltransferase involved in cell wall biosynthesis
MHPAPVVLHIIWSAEIGGISKVVWQLCAAQRNSDAVHPMLYIAQPKGDLLQEIERSDVTVVKGAFLHGALCTPAHFADIANLMKKADILHFHTFNPVLAFCAVRSGKPIVYTEHGNFGFGRKFGIAERIIRRLQRRFLNKSVRAISFNSRFSLLESETRNGLRHVRKEVIYNGVEDIAHLESGSQSQSDSDTLRIAAIGRLVNVKRFDRILRTLSLVNKENVHLTIMGDGPLREEIGEIAHELHLGNKVQFAGSGNGKQLLQQSDLCIVGSQGEAFGLVAVEAYQQGIPVLTFSDGGGVTEIVQAIAPEHICKDECAMAELVTKFAADKKNHILLRSDSLRTYAHGFSMQKMQDHFNQLYRSL